MQRHGTPAKVPKLRNHVSEPTRSTKVMIRGLHVLKDKVSKYHEVTRFQNRSRSFKEQHIAAWTEQTDFVICQGEQTIQFYRKGVESSQQTNDKHSKTN